MSANKITGKQLRNIGFPEGRVIAVVMSVMGEHYKGKSKVFKMSLLRKVIETPAFYVKHETLSPIAKGLLIIEESKKNLELRKNRIPYAIYGGEGIEPGAINQMEIAMKLPVAEAGALMPDAHQGYGLPIGGVLATKNAVIPYGVGVDIGCRMCMTLYDIPAVFEREHSNRMKKMLIDNARFGNAAFERPMDHEVLHRELFSEINILKSLKERAAKQIGSSGGGNHFVEFGIAEIMEKDNDWDLPVGKYLSLLTHSGSRGLGANIARHYTKLAMDTCSLPSAAKHLAWLNLDQENGQEYWAAMNLAGDYASACHHHIHERMAKSLGDRPLAMIENHHNFAWKEKDGDGNEMIVHRKGATPAGKGVLGIIPGSMTSPGFIVRGKGEMASLNSASHGAGRLMSRRRAKETLSKVEVDQQLKNSGIELIGSGLDEAPMVYKNIHNVMARQKSLVETVGTFTPKVVRMCGDQKFGEVD